MSHSGSLQLTFFLDAPITDERLSLRVKNRMLVCVGPSTGRYLTQCCKSMRHARRVREATLVTWPLIRVFIYIEIARWPCGQLSYI